MFSPEILDLVQIRDDLLSASSTNTSVSGVVQRVCNHLSDLDTSDQDISRHRQGPLKTSETYISHHFGQYAL